VKTSLANKLSEGHPNAMMMMKSLTTTILVAALFLVRTGALHLFGPLPHSYAEGDE
jgi:hypothetical protein